jgi:N,N'-diacetyllegionaminate synthase
MVNSIDVGGSLVGAGQPCFIIAEAGVNHNGDLAMAMELVDVAADCGADAIKFQTFKAENLVTAEAPKADYQLEVTDPNESWLTMLERLELSPDAHRQLMQACQSRNIQFISTPFEEDSADLLEELGVHAFKIPSGEISNLPFLEYVGRKGKPVILSTGMAFLGEVESAILTLENAGSKDIAVLHCVSNYPADPADVNLRTMKTMARAFEAPVGYSDHTLGAEVTLAAVAMGACIVEKHFTLDRNLEGPDHQASLDPDELREMVQGIRKVEKAMGSSRKRPTANEMPTLKAARKSLVARCDLKAGSVLTKDCIAIKRPGTGYAPAKLPELVGRTLVRDVSVGTVFSAEMLG